MRDRGYGVLPGDTPRTPVFVLTGFLGSGKTTLLSRLVRQPDLADTAVIINEFGEVGLDHLLVASGEEDDVVLLDSGCLCCALNSSLGETLNDLFYRRARSEVPPFRRVVIETSGLADPAPILNTLMSDRFIASRFGLAAVIATVDSLNLLHQLSRHDEVAKQIAVADWLLLTKTDAAEPEAVEAVRQRLQALNPRARCLAVAHGDVDPSALLAVAPWSGTADPGTPGMDEQREPCDHKHNHNGGRHETDIVSVYGAVPDAVGWAAYAAWVGHLQRSFGERLLRVKGLLHFEGEAQPRVVQGVQHVFAPPEELDADLAVPPGLVFIARSVEPSALRDSLALLTDTVGSRGDA